VRGSSLTRQSAPDPAEHSQSRQHGSDYIPVNGKGVAKSLDQFLQFDSTPFTEPQVIRFLARSGSSLREENALLFDTIRSHLIVSGAISFPPNELRIRIRVWWADENAWFEGEASPGNRRSLLLNYDDGDIEEMDMRSETYELLAPASMPETVEAVSLQQDKMASTPEEDDADCESLELDQPFENPFDIFKEPTLLLNVWWPNDNREFI
jgi:hypothetical protein